MNGQLNHLIRTVESLKKYLEHGEENIKEKASYIESVNFLMPVDSSKCNSFEEEIELKEMDPREYMENLAERRCRGIYIVLEIGKEDRNLSALQTVTRDMYMYVILARDTRCGRTALTTMVRNGM